MHSDLRKGTIKAWPDKDVFIFEKKDKKETLLVIVNVRNKAKTIQMPDNWKGRKAKDQATEKEYQLDASLTLEPFQYLILKENRSI